MLDDRHRLLRSGALRRGKAVQCARPIDPRSSPSQTRDLLLKYDESHVSTKHKFGIIYQRTDQVTEEDIFSNETHGIAMNHFLALIGDRVKLKDFRG